MNQIRPNILNTIGNTPIVKLGRIAKDVPSEIYLKLEFMNPGGSIKDRIGKYILEQALKRGDIKPGGTIIEGTSGNTGVGLAMFAALHDLKTIFVLADKQSPEKINNLRAFGAKVIVCPTNVEPQDPRSYYSVSKRLSETIPNSYFVNQYDNLLNRETHVKTTGPEIWEQTQGQFDVFCATVGTGGTISGIGEYLKSKNPNIKVVGVDCEGSILAHYHKTGKICEAKPYVLEGIGEDILPQNLDFSVIDDFVVINDKESFLMTRALLTQEAIYAGGSSGAAVVGAIKYAKTLKEPKRILVVLPDSGNRYTSKIFNDDWMRDNGYHDSSFNVSIHEVLGNLGRKQREIYKIFETTTIGAAVSSMETHGVSQLPVYAGEQIIGVVTEHKLLRPLFERKLSLTDTVSVALERNFVLIDAYEMLERVASSLVDKKIVLIMKNGKVIDILTDIDVLHFISSKGNFK